MLVTDPEVQLAISYSPKQARVALVALFVLDARLGEIARGTRDPMAAQLKLTWWHDALNRLDIAPPPAEPLLQALAAEVLPKGIAGNELAALIDGWEALLEEGGANLALVGARGALLFGLATRALEAREPAGLIGAGQGWALVELARHAPTAAEAHGALRAADQALKQRPRRWATPLRPLGALTALAVSDAARGADRLEPVASPRRVVRMLALRLTGR